MVNQVLIFLAQELQEADSYSALNTSRSAISLISDNGIGNHPIIKRFCKGASNLKPQKPKYDFIWDPAPVISALASIYPYDPLPLEVITKKLILLLALGSGQRVQTLTAIKIPHISISKDRLIITVSELRAQVARNHSLRSLASSIVQNFALFLF